MSVAHLLFSEDHNQTEGPVVTCIELCLSSGNAHHKQLKVTHHEEQETFLDRLYLYPSVCLTKNSTYGAERKKKVLSL